MDASCNDRTNQLLRPAILKIMTCKHVLNAKNQSINMNFIKNHPDQRRSALYAGNATAIIKNQDIQKEKSMKRYDYYIGIDCGVNTGMCVWDAKDKNIWFIGTTNIHTAMEEVKRFSKTAKIMVRVEDARQRKWFGNTGRERLKGAGSVSRDAKIWEDYLKYLNVDFEMVAPKNNKTKMSAETFKKYTNYSGSTSVHARDAAMLVYGFL
jgi:hypothetical protein